MSEFVKVNQLVNKINLEVVSGNQQSLERKITTADISRPGLELTGYFSYYTHERIQMFGKKEVSFSEQMVPSERLMIMRKLTCQDTPAIIVARGLEVAEEMKIAAEEKNVPILRSTVATSRLVGEVSSFLDDRLASRTSIHGVLMDIYGLGVLIQGDSGIGKSETGLELLKRGHRLVADDRVDVYQKDELTAVGEPPKILEHMLEIRGVGIIDVMNLFGASAVRNSMQVQLAIYLENFSTDKAYDRLGNGTQNISIAGVDIPQLKIPVKTGRNLSIIIEAAAMNFRAKTMGFDATAEFGKRLDRLINQNSSEGEA
ncbi:MULTISPECIES: HPr(Ser) kinase/phosphatase [unclassified Enterococcus]|uniref:HPr(Ser) kinase/phosphatase n=1 Tax=unclassified Enterococcus TaxID=2608891 RepID=UPI00155356F1|nr:MULTISPECIES: HPr(Ser) kinase/phosphatase [unclassified Enterococcus]MBS7577521.1 HPr kinase/phosphorylase [Enterococcus sp. MMGLQ5-2]MBS7584980.1 HPr kinase/phosphorylase [Enterococcus sp. MMGLQ5-1]NPD12835.1 HPr kinase/phosphorylase [Enterococcus sp. MMGLQ5-1]NPD37354.1 HPr kinase/phosphorylase [Enterococcus sp. MMGLQ5-2]